MAKHLGVLMLNMRTGEFVMVRAKAVLLGTGGGPTMYKYHTPSGDKSCDGMAMLSLAFNRVGCALSPWPPINHRSTGLGSGPSMP